MVVHYRHDAEVDIVVANAGVELVDTPFVGYDEAQYDQVFDTNSNTTRLALPGLAVYGASKLAPLYFVEVLAKELGPRGITVNSVVPWATLAAGVFADSAEGELAVRLLVERTPLGRLATPGDVAGVVSVLVGNDATLITGQHLAVDGGASI